MCGDGLESNSSFTCLFFFSSFFLSKMIQKPGLNLHLRFLAIFTYGLQDMGENTLPLFIGRDRSHDRYAHRYPVNRRLIVLYFFIIIQYS